MREMIGSFLNNCVTPDSVKSLGLSFQASKKAPSLAKFLRFLMINRDIFLSGLTQNWWYPQQIAAFYSRRNAFGTSPTKQLLKNGGVLR